MRILLEDDSLANFDPLRGCPQARSFADKDAADFYVTRHLTWTAENGNHRCPTCGPARPNQRVGMYVDAITGKEV